VTVPTAQNLLLPNDFVAFLDEEMRNEIIPLVMGYRQEFFVHNYDITPQANQVEFVIPERAIGGKVRDVVLVTPNGEESQIPRLEPDQLKQTTVIPNLRLFGFYFENDTVIIYPGSTDLSAQTLRIKYFRRPGILVQRTQAGQITAINPGTNEVTVGSAPTTWTVNLEYDAIGGTPIFKSHGDDNVITSLVGPVLTFTALPADMVVGDWIAEAGYSPIPQVPYETFNLLVQRGVMRVCEALKDANGYKLAKDAYQEMLGRFSAMIVPRADGSPQKVTNPSGVMDFSGVNRRIW
jgi:hypothetical protein